MYEIFSDYLEEKKEQNAGGAREPFLDTKQSGLLSILCGPGCLEIHSVGFLDVEK